MITRHIAERFQQRYAIDLTVDILREIVTLALESKNCRPNYHRPGAEEIVVHWRGADLFLVWDRERRFIYTFLPPLISRPPKRGRRRWSR